MTSMNFNTISQQTAIPQQAKSLTLKEGQIFHGSIKQLFPDQIAEVQVGGNKLIAKLETPLKAGDSHYFQVTNTNGQVELKVVTGPMAQATPAQQMTQLMDSMNLPKTVEMRQVMTHFIQNNLPMSKEQLVQAEAWLKAMPDSASKAVALQAMTRMIELKMPFTNDVFQALMNGSKPFGMADALATLQLKINQDVSLNPSIKANIQQQLQTIQQPFQQQVAANLLATATNTLLDSTAGVANKLEVMSILKQAGVLSSQATLSNIMSNNQRVTQAPTNYGQFMAQLNTSTPADATQVTQKLQAYIAQDNTLLPEQKLQLQQQLNQFQQMPKTTDAIQQFTKQFSEQLMKFESSNQLANVGVTSQQNLTPVDQLLSILKPETTSNSLQTMHQLVSQSSSTFIQNMLTEAEQHTQKNIDAKQVEHAMKTVLRSLGLNYESVIGSNKVDQIDAAAQTLKPQLLNLVNDPLVSVPLKEAAETVLTRLNGMQLLSTDNGHQHQIVMQVPLDFLGKKMDATLHWNGRMKDDGKIDSNYARVLFYLNMESLKETVIDMQVQNRIVSVTVFNEYTNLQPLANVLKEKLAVGLEEKGYQLSGIQMKTFEQSESPKKKVGKLEEKGHSGVDIRI